MGRTKKKEQTPEDIARDAALSLERSKQELLKYFKLGFIRLPTRQFEIGNRVVWGAHEHVVVIDKTPDGVLYLCHSKYERTIEKGSHTRAGNVDVKHWMPWHDLFPYKTPEECSKLEQFAKRDEMRLTFYQSTIHSFNSNVYHFGVDMDPDYQRGLVWSLEDKQKLIESIFNNVDIGKFVFINLEHGHPTGCLRSVLDGKQRLNAIVEFWEDRFEYRGKKFSELHPHDKHKINGHSISMAEISNPTKEQIYSYFIKLNTGGKPMNLNHLDKVKDLLAEERKNNK